MDVTVDLLDARLEFFGTVDATLGVEPMSMDELSIRTIAHEGFKLFVERDGKVVRRGRPDAELPPGEYLITGDGLLKDGRPWDHV